MSEAILKREKSDSKSLSPVKRAGKKINKAVAGEFKLPVYSCDGKAVENIVLDKKVFDGKVNKKVLHQAVICYQANIRMGCASTKTKGEVSGGGKKPYKQKGTGRARAGSSRSPLWRHGGVTFGPRPRDFSYTIPKKIRLVALRSGLNAKLNSGNLILLDEIKLDEIKTKEAVKIFSGLPEISVKGKLTRPTLGVFEATPDMLRCMRNISNFSILRPQDITAYDVLRYRKILISKSALQKVIKRISSLDIK